MATDCNDQRVLSSSFYETELVDEEDWGDSFEEKLVIECLCPGCGLKHELPLFWTGRGTPRKYCPSCRKKY